MMEKKLVIVPFDVELAKKITNGEVEGIIIDERSYHYRLVCFDLLDDKGKIIGLRKNDNYTETALTFNNNGYCVQHSKCILSLEIPEYMTFKDGDVLISECGTPFIYKDIKGRHGCFSAYCAIDLQDKIFFDIKDWTYDIKCKADESQCKILIDKLKESKEPKAKECLKMLGIEVKQEYEFKPFDRVLVRDYDDGVWKADIFLNNSYGCNYMCTGNVVWAQCIPYNEQTAHLLGTNKEWKE